MATALTAITLIPFLLSLVVSLPQLRQALRPTGLAWGMAGVMALLFFWLLTFLPTVTEQGVIVVRFDWVPDLDLALTWYVDGLALMFALIVTGIGVVVYLYAGYYFDGDLDETGRFYMQLSLFTGAMLALVLAGNIVTLFIAWELTSITSFLLIGFKGNKEKDARVSASRALLVTGGGGLALLAGLLLLGAAAGSYEIADILADPEMLRAHPWYTGIAILVMLGCFTKSAQFPFHFWLPGAMTAPSPASAYLHSATMVKAGVYLLLRLYPALGNTNLWFYGLLFFGVTTMFVGALFAIRKRDLKGLLAYSTVSKLGALVALISLPNGAGLMAALVGILAHALYKGTLFLLAGVIEHSTGTRDLDQLGGLRARMPGTALIAAVVGLSMAGFPPLLGFVAKEVLLGAMLLDTLGVIPIAFVFVASVLTVVAALLFVWDVFVSRPDQEYHHFHAPSPGLIAGPGLLALLSLLTALTIPATIIPVITPALATEFSLYLIPPYVNTAVILSVAVLVLGPLVFAVRGSWLTMRWPEFPSGIQLYAGTVGLVEWFGDQLLKTQGGKVRYYLVSILGVVAVLMFLGGYENLRTLELIFPGGSADLLKVLLLILALGATLASIILKKHLLAALAMGVMGYAVGGLFLLEPAPDVALVQFLVETLATVLIILMIARISTRQREEVMQVIWRGRREGRLGIWRDAAISVVMGVSVGLFALAAVNDRPVRVQEMNPISLWHIENAYPQTGATDVVAAILTDFRATDTLLEITVFGMAALGVLTLLTLPEGRELLTGRRITQVMRLVALANAPKSRQEEVIEQPEDRAVIDAAEEGDAEAIQAVAEAEPGEVVNPIDTGEGDTSAMEDLRMPDQKDEDSSTYTETDDLARYGTVRGMHNVPRFSTPLTRTVATMVLPFALLISGAHVLYGSGAPGDGFTAGVVGGLAVGLWYVVFGYFEARERLSWLHPGRLMAIGLLLAVLNAFAGLFLAEGFFNIFKLGDGHGPAGLHLASSLVFEIAIFLTVFGGACTIMEAIAHPEELEQDA
jgi:NADH:ubiquinone oxidoreductase subunit 5 (subunit L)/multisubunit Na+/H+ antiporter MnhA subunit